ncbi:MAG: hypothetical protein LBD08_05215 [Treponema sp.]|nr:hypothetical protein [Treponema sp.]
MPYEFLTPLNAVPQPTLPDPFLGPDGWRIRTVEDWPLQRSYIKEMLAYYLYGFMPENSGYAGGVCLISEDAYQGRALKERVQIRCGPEGAVVFEVLIIRPKTGVPVPFFIWNQFSDMSPCPIEEEAVCRYGYGIAAFNREQLARDEQGAAALRGPCMDAYPGQSWRALAMWAWGMSRIADYLEQTGLADRKQFIAAGFSRGGKAALCAAIYDERFAVCAAACSGCGGAGNFRYLGSRLGSGTGTCESLGDITRKNKYWYWFSDRAAVYGNQSQPSSLGQEALLPFDLHFVRAAIAPRMLITTEGLDDVWSNPFGTQLSWYASQPVYEWLGVPAHNVMRFREGGHAFNAEDWRAVIEYSHAAFRGDAMARFSRSSGGLELNAYFDWNRP